MYISVIYWRYCRRHYAAMKRRGMGDYVLIGMGYMCSIWRGPEGQEVRHVD